MHFFKVYDLFPFYYYKIIYVGYFARSVMGELECSFRNNILKLFECYDVHKGMNKYNDIINYIPEQSANTLFSLTKYDGNGQNEYFFVEPNN